MIDLLALTGQASLILALCFALLQGILPLIGFYRHHLYLFSSARALALGQCGFVSVGLITLMVAFVMNDFTITYVAENSHAALPLMYKFTALWGAHEGSILLWIWILNVWTIAYSLFSSIHPEPLPPLVLALLGLISFALLSFLIFTSNPFATALSRVAGQDLNPLLQDPGFVIHPPMLYAGYVGFVMPFAITLAALLQNRCEGVAWATAAHRFALAAFSFLTLGIVLGSWWAYRVLGWGGFWFWDPVENASLLPWLSGTALIHVLLLTQKQGTAKSWAALLAIITFTLSVLGTFLVRSGVLVSVHAFANDPKRGAFLLILLTLLLLNSLIIYFIRMPLTSSPSRIRLSREKGLLLNSAFLTTAMLTVLLGTLYPMILEALHINLISVGAPYFNSVMMPLVFIMMIIMGFSLYLPPQNQSITVRWQAAFKKAFISGISAYLLLWLLSQSSVITWAGLSVSIWVLLSLLQPSRLSIGVILAHTGFAVCVSGIVLSSLLAQEKEIRMKPGDATHLGPYQFFFVEATEKDGPNYRAISATFDVFKQTHRVAVLHPEKRIYPIRDMVMTKAAIQAGLFRDLYIALGEPLAGEDWSVHLYYKPFIRWIWCGGILMTLGGISAIVNQSTRQKRREVA
jgi:cytochrome c-type biogenesis protein CcmF